MPVGATVAVATSCILEWAGFIASPPTSDHPRLRIPWQARKTGEFKSDLLAWVHLCWERFAWDVLLYGSFDRWHRYIGDTAVIEPASQVSTLGHWWCKVIKINLQKVSQPKYNSNLSNVATGARFWRPLHFFTSDLRWNWISNGSWSTKK